MTSRLEPGEFELIARYFHGMVRRDDVELGVGDDGALLTPPADTRLVQVVDTLVADGHFPADADAHAVGHRALAVNLSDLAAMAAEPAWALLALTVPARDEAWLAEFAHGFQELAARYGVALVGGDTTRGPLTVTVQLSGFAERPLRRSGARPGDRVWVSGDLGAAAGGLRAWQAGWRDGDAHELIRRFLYPEPRCDLGAALAGVASAAIDISDGLVADAGHVAERSGAGLSLVSAQLPRAGALMRRLGDEDALELALRGGDDYELLFTAPPTHDADVEAAASRAGVAVTAIGDVTAGSGVRVDDQPAQGGYDHFGDGRP